MPSADSGSNDSRRLLAVARFLAADALRGNRVLICKAIVIIQ